MPFFDDFNDGNENDYVESRTGWERVDGVAGNAQINANGQVKFTSTTDTAYRCTDQGSVDQYSFCKRLQSASRGYIEIANRITDSDNFIGLSYTVGRLRIYKRNTGSFTDIGNYVVTINVGDIIGLLSNGNDHVAYINGIAVIGPITDSFNNTETRQGFVARNVTEDPVLDEYFAATKDEITLKNGSINLLGVGY
jgi:hypothetical protein